MTATENDRRTPLAVIVAGPPAGGKSTFGRACATVLRAALLDQDVLTGPLTAVVAGLLHTDDLDSAVLADATRHARYESIVATAVDTLRCGTPTVLVAPFTAERTDAALWRALNHRLSAAGGQVHLAWLDLPDDLLLARLRARDADRDRNKLADPEGFLRRQRASAPTVRHIAVDARLPAREQVGQFLAAVR